MYNIIISCPIWFGSYVKVITNRTSFIDHSTMVFVRVLAWKYLLVELDSAPYRGHKLLEVAVQTKQSSANHLLSLGKIMWS